MLSGVLSYIVFAYGKCGVCFVFCGLSVLRDVEDKTVEQARKAYLCPKQPRKQNKVQVFPDSWDNF